MKWAGIALMVVSILIVVVSILFVLVVWSWTAQAAMERFETDPIGGQLDIGILCVLGSFLGVMPFLVGVFLFLAGGSLLAAWIVADRRK